MHDQLQSQKYYKNSNEVNGTGVDSIDRLSPTYLPRLHTIQNKFPCFHSDCCYDALIEFHSFLQISGNPKD